MRLQTLVALLVGLWLSAQLVCSQGRVLDIAELHTLDGGLHAVVFTPDSKTLAVSSDKDVVLFDVKTAKRGQTFTGHESEVTVLAFSKDGTTLLSGDSDGQVRFWQVSGGKHLRTIVSPGHTVDALAMSPDGKHVAIAVRDRPLTLWEVATGKKLYEVEDARHCDCIVFSPDGKLAAAAGRTEAILFETKSGKKLHTFGDDFAVGTVAFSPDGKTILLETTGDTLTLRDTKTGKEIWTSVSPRAQIHQLLFRPDGKTIITGGDSHIEFWDARDGRRLRSRRFCEHAWNAPVAISADGKMLASGYQVREEDSHVPRVKLWTFREGGERNILFAGDSVLSLAYSTDGKQIGAAVHGGSLTLWHADGRPLREIKLKGKERHLFAIDFSPDNKLIAAGCNENEVVLFDADTGAPSQVIKTPSNWTRVVRFSPDGKLLAYASGGKLLIWDVQAKIQMREIAAHDATIESIAFSLDGTQIVTCADGVKLWTVATGKHVRTLDVPRDLFNCVAWAPDGRTIACGGRSGHTRMVEAATGKELYAVKEDEDVMSIAFSPDGSIIAVGGMAGALRLRTSANGELAHELQVGNLYPCESLSFSLDGRSLMQCGELGAVVIWAVPGKD